MKKLVLIAILFCSSQLPAFGQSGNGQSSSGSIYSSIGVGYPVGLANTGAESMGLTGVSYNETFVGAMANPAHWGNTLYGLGSGGIKLQSFDATESANSVTNTNFTIDHFQLQLPVVRGKVGISGSFSPITQSQFNVIQTSSAIIGQGATQDTLVYGIQNAGSGGINRAELGFGWRINKNLSVGYAGSLVLMSQDNTVTGSFADPTYRGLNNTYETSGLGFGNRFGAQLDLPDIFGTDDRIGVGAALSLPVSISAHQKKSSSLSNAPDKNLGDGTVKLPLTAAAGLNFRPSPLIMIATEGLYEPWSNYRNDFKSNSRVTFVDRYKWGLGMQYMPYRNGSDKFFSHFKYRLGASYDTGSMRLSNGSQAEGKRINTLMFSVGLGILSAGGPNSSSSIDLSFKYGIRGTNDMNLVKEQIWGVGLSLNLAELMFYRPKLK